MIKAPSFALLAIPILAAGLAINCGDGAPQSAPTESTSATIVRAIDGDTLEVELRNGRRRDVRLIGIDAPETVRPNTPVECGGRWASKRAARFAGELVRLIADPTQDTIDRYGRLLRYVVTTTGTDIGKSQLARGLAAVYIYRDPFQRLSTYERTSEIARAAGRGAWGTCGGDFHKPIG